MKNKIILIGGPTGVGKTALGIKLANMFNGEIISCDSIAIYKYLDIGSAKPTKEEQSMVIHHQIDIVNPNDEYSVAEFVQSTRKLIEEIISRNKVPIIVGGTGLYMKALLFPYEFMNSSKNEEIRHKYENMAKEFGKEYVYNYLKQIDSESALKLHSNDLKRVIRAIEIYETTGKKKVNNCNKESLYDFHLIFLNGDRNEIYSKINKRVDLMIAGGLQNEVESLIKNFNLSKDNQSMQGIGYKEWFDYFDNKISKQQLIDNIKINSRHYAKRQITWFKQMPDVLEYNYKDVNQIILGVKRFLNMDKIFTIAIDGPAGAGKTTVAKLVAKKLDILYLNTGAMYRALALKCLKLNKNPENTIDAHEIALNTNLDVEYKNGEQVIFIDGNEINDFLYTDEISDYASKISKHQEIREKCVNIQRQIAKKQSIIVDGRDIGTVVLKDAKFKFYLDAKVEERARRRFLDLSKKDSTVTYEKVLEDIKMRDYNDIHRNVSPLKVADDAIVIDSTNLSVEEVANKILSIIEE